MTTSILVIIVVVVIVSRVVVVVIIAIVVFDIRGLVDVHGHVLHVIRGCGIRRLHIRLVHHVGLLRRDSGGHRGLIYLWWTHVRIRRGGLVINILLIGLLLL